MVRRLMILAFAGLVLMAGPVRAGETYPPPVCTSEVLPDGTLIVRCSGCDPNTEVTAEVRTTSDTTAVTAGIRAAGGGTLVATVTGTTDAQGNLSMSKTGLPPGTYDVTIIGCGAQVLRVTIPNAQVTTPSSVDVTNAVPLSGNLPRTGSDSLPLLRLAIVLLAAGALALFAARRRRSVRT